MESKSIIVELRIQTNMSLTPGEIAMDLLEAEMRLNEGKLRYHLINVTLNQIKILSKLGKDEADDQLA